MALVMNEYSNEKIDVSKVIKMVLIHDIIEIDAGDVIVYDTQMRTLAEEKEKIAAERIFGILPDEQKEVFIGLWREFEEKKTPESKFLDRRYVRFSENNVYGHMRSNIMPIGIL